MSEDEEAETDLYIECCAGCNHWREYEYIGELLGYKVYRCPTCGTVIFKVRDYV